MRTFLTGLFSLILTLGTFGQTLSCIGDTDTQSDNPQHTQALLHVSRNNFLILSFGGPDLKPGTYGAQVFLPFTGPVPNLTLSVYTADNQTWKEGQSLPKDDLELVTGPLDPGTRTLKIPRLTLAPGQTQIVLVISADTDHWNALSSRTGPQAPSLTFTAPSGPTPASETPPAKIPMKIGTNFWFLAEWSGETPFIKGVDFARAWTTGGNIWNPEFLKDLEPFALLRFMDWGGTNNSKISRWDQRKKPEDPSNRATDHIGPGDPLKPGLAYEWMIDLANRTQKDLWICVPHLADDAYIKNLAQLLKTRTAPDRKIFLEYSNETWNGSFTQFEHTLTQGQNLGLPGDNKYYQGGAYSILRSYQIFEIFHQVFGPAQRSRWKAVLSFSGNFDIFLQSYKALEKHPRFNPQAWVPDYLAVAPYVGADLDGLDPKIQEKWDKEVRQVLRDYVIPAAKIARQLGRPLITYEGGQHLLKNADAWSQHPGIRAAYLSMLQTFAPHFEIFNHYALTGVWKSDGAWGAKAFTGQKNSGKYQALLDAMKP